MREPWVLVVDDDADNLEAIVEALCDAGIEVRGARSSVEAVSLATRGPRPRLILCDYVMPHIDGSGLSELIRGARPDVSIVIMTAMPRAAVPAGLGLPVLEKPFSCAELFTVVDRYCQVRSRRPSPGNRNAPSGDAAVGA